MTLESISLFPLFYHYCYYRRNKFQSKIIMRCYILLISCCALCVVFVFLWDVRVAHVSTVLFIFFSPSTFGWWLMCFRRHSSWLIAISAHYYATTVSVRCLILIRLLLFIIHSFTAWVNGINFFLGSVFRVCLSSFIRLATRQWALIGKSRRQVNDGILWKWQYE